MVLIDEQPQHFHVGTLRYQNFIRSDVSDWGIKEELNAYVVEKLDGVNGQQVVLVEPTPGLQSRATKMIKPGWDSLLFNDAIEDHVLASLAGHDLDFLLTVEPMEGDIEYGVSVTASNYGLYTRCHFIQGCNARALRHFTVRAYALNPLRLAAMVDIQQGTTAVEDSRVEINWPEDINNLSAQELDRAKELVTASALRSIDMVAKNASFHSR
ncbi:hypothetical protein BVH74_11375 [Halopseudomonas phragmitis]|uniref:Uncharacterized protein n=2 Tax=Halopseudomonas phragmitis TaxID=1931241 RepID=A0A1V0B5V9_9GAMM|nr:hypothetical protein BVH74_11375 [Halopseudomonas phragmitis]